MNWKRERKWKGETWWSVSKNRMTRIILYNSLGRPGITHSIHLTVNFIPSPFKSKLGWGENKRQLKSVKLLMWVFHYRFPEISPACPLAHQGLFTKRKTRDEKYSGFSIVYWELSLNKTNLTKEAHNCSSVCALGDMISANPSSFFWTFFPVKKAAHFHRKSV